MLGPQPSVTLCLKLRWGGGRGELGKGGEGGGGGEGLMLLLFSSLHTAVWK